MYNRSAEIKSIVLPVLLVNGNVGHFLIYSYELLFSSADEGFDGTYATNVVVKSNGSCAYIPPGIFKSTCKIDITWFPFDEQVTNGTSFFKLDNVPRRYKHALFLLNHAALRNEG